MTFTKGSSALACADCGKEITLEQYRRKVPTCDDCEARRVVASWFEPPSTTWGKP